MWILTQRRPVSLLLELPQGALGAEQGLQYWKTKARDEGGTAGSKGGSEALVRSLLYFLTQFFKLRGEGLVKEP